MKKSKPSKQAGNLTKRESNKGDSKGIKSLNLKLNLYLRPVLNYSFKYYDYLQSNYNVSTGSKEHKQIEIYSKKVIDELKSCLLKIKEIHSSLETKEDKTIFRNTLSGYLNQFGSHFHKHTEELRGYLTSGQKKAAKKSLEARKKISTNWKELFLKFRAEYLQRNQKLDNTIPESQIINSFREQNPKAPKESTLYNYLSKK